MSVAFAVAAPASGCGKTTVTMGLIAAFRRRGLIVQPFKTGPDYIDSAYLSKLAGRPCVNLDSWMTSDGFVKETFARHAHDADVAVIEGVMGLFDGNEEGAGSTARVAKLLDVPVLHIVDAGKSAQTAAAVLHGLASFDTEITSLGAIFNKVASAGHLQSVLNGFQEVSLPPVLGHLPRNPDLMLPERQLGLVSAFEQGLPDSFIDHLVEAVEEHFDLNAILAAPELSVPEPKPWKSREKSIRLGIATDEAFCFYYKDNLDLLESAGMELVSFSPLHDEALPNALDGLYLGGGFPEEYVGQLAENAFMLEAVRNFEGKILAECGGLIYLTSGLVGRIDGQIEMTDKLQACGYRDVSFNRGTILGPAGTSLRGHEFHWSKWVEEPAENFGAMQTGARSWGYADDQILASYFHIHFGSNPAVVDYFREALSR